MIEDEDCGCSPVYLNSGREQVGTEWHEKCPVHGLVSEWYNSPEQKTKRAERSARLRDLQLQAREARKNAGR